MDKTALFSLSYGVYIVSTLDGARPVGCVVNSIFQVSASPATLAISINRDNYTNPCLLKTGRFAVSILGETAAEALIGRFGFHSGRDTDKFDGVAHRRTPGGLPVVTDGVCGYLECRVIDSVDCFTHTVVLAEIVEAERLADLPPMTYAYYHKVVKGKAPKNAPTYVEEEAPGGGTYVCTICGYAYPGTLEEFEALPDSYTCPLCGAVKALFAVQ